MNEHALMNVLLAPKVTEKSALIGDANNQFVFRVLPRARKQDIKRAVELMFKVEVASVQVLNVRGKIKGARGSSGRRAGWKKAYVRLKPGFDIDFMDTE